MSSKLKALHCWNICCYFGLRVDQDHAMMCLYIFTFREFILLWSHCISRFWFANCLLNTYGRESKGGIFWKSDFLSFLFTLEATGRRLQWPKKLKNKSLWMIYSSILRNEYCFVLKSQSCIPWKNLKYLRHFQELCFQLD